MIPQTWLVSLLIGLLSFSLTKALSCYKCTAYKFNDTCVDEFRQVDTLDGQFMCRVFERNGKVVSQGIVEVKLCSGNRKRIPGTMALMGLGDIHVGCCGTDFCNTAFCEAEGRSNDPTCSSLLNPPKIPAATGGTVGRQTNRPLSNTVNKPAAEATTEKQESKPLKESSQEGTELKSASFGGSLPLARGGATQLRRELLVILLPFVIFKL